MNSISDEHYLIFINITKSYMKKYDMAVKTELEDIEVVLIYDEKEDDISLSSSKEIHSIMQNWTVEQKKEYVFGLCKTAVKDFIEREGGNSLVGNINNLTFTVTMDDEKELYIDVKEKPCS